MALGRFGGIKHGGGGAGAASYGSGFAGALLALASDELQADAFLRDGISRGLERLGKDALPLLVHAAGGDDARLSQAALFTLESWRGDDALSTLISTATEVNPKLPEETRVELFRTLREMLPRVPADPIAQWVSQKRGAGPRSRVQAVQLLAAMHERAVLAVAPILPALLNDPEAEVRKAALVLARDVRSDRAGEILLITVRSQDRTGEERTLALTALRGYEGVDLAPLARELSTKTSDPALLIELMRTLASRDFEPAARTAEGLLDSKIREIRHEAIALLGSRPRTAQAVARRYLDGKLPPEDLSRVIDAVRIHDTPELKSTLQTLLTKTLLAPPEVSRLRQFVARWGNTQRGRSVYMDARKGNCAACHRMEGVGGNVGPDLTRVWETLSFDKRVESILDPSKEIKEGFGTYKVATVNGRVLTGLLLSDTPEAVTLKDAEGREVRIPAKEIDEKHPDKTSLMPTGVVGHLSFNELADLLAFLGDRQAQEALRATKPTDSR
jgi:putative heme-binding domain-containing protein